MRLLKESLFLSPSSGRCAAFYAAHNDPNRSIIISMHYVYILKSEKRQNWLYKGSTSDLKRRFAEHNAGKNFSTAPYTPLKLIYYEAYLLKSDAESREKYLKTSMGMRVIKKQLENYLRQSVIG